MNKSLSNIVAIYARVSSEQQAKQRPLPAKWRHWNNGSSRTTSYWNPRCVFWMKGTAEQP